MKQDMTMTHPLGCVCYTATGGALLPPGAYRLTDLASGVKIDVIIHAAHVDDEVSLPEHLRTAEFDAAWKLWIKSKRKKPSKPAIVMQTNRLAAMTHDDAIASIKQPSTRYITMMSARMP